MRRKGAEKNESIVVAFKFTAVVVTLGVAHFLSKSFVRNELLPVHADKDNENK